ncbi:hypothetical protein KJE20_03627 [Pyrenophora tritici-repentis]|uniref:Uncharacterized protein n=1 Tax=Pyrenophora tritici-repentis TaxID=45151 RepID=A0A922N1A0_9PLEO|nr:hypothetical protein Ptr86124_013400 [Pyrenophora tritici-repentis]KAI1685662.1 hypothetical protein KJE20_03627 [Pyrenophora tritici-repentis]
MAPLELQVLESTQRRQRARRHQRGAGKRGGRRDPSLLERLDSNNRAAAPPSTLPARMTESSVPAENVFVFQSRQPASTTPTTATTALVLIEPSTAVAEFSQLSPASPRSVNRLPDLRAIQWVVYWRLYTGSSAGVAINSANGTELSGSTSAIAAAVAGNKLSAASC